MQIYSLVTHQIINQSVLCLCIDERTNLLTFYLYSYIIKTI